MQTLRIRHRTEYRYHEPVTFGEHRLMFRPRDSHDLRHVSSQLTISPTAEVRWHHDVFSNSIAITEFKDAADHLTFESEVVVVHYGNEETEFPIDTYARHLPFAYSCDEVGDLARTNERHYPDPEQTVDQWAIGYLEQGNNETDKVLAAMTHAIGSSFDYVTRLEEGTQTPNETLQRRQGTCRDFALLLIEAARSLGLAARFVTGYLYDPLEETGGKGLLGTGATHAWVQVFLPGAGWIEYDPTNGIIGGANLIRVAVTRDPSQAIVVRGSYFGAPEAFKDMQVSVEVERI
ncbi:MAG: transglutaminase family protein [Sneathiella sp.]|nr:transglutaminase family protein [Sneathiella sp.]